MEGATVGSATEPPLPLFPSLIGAKPSPKEVGLSVPPEENRHSVRLWPGMEGGMDVLGLPTNRSPRDKAHQKSKHLINAAVGECRTSIRGFPSSFRLPLQLVDESTSATACCICCSGGLASSLRHLLHQSNKSCDRFSVWSRRRLV
jgi:hypothetical protein